MEQRFMSTRTHNKKKNSILLYEFLVRTISKALVEGDKKKSSAALKILRKHYKPGTQLYKEFRLMNSLAKTSVSSQHVAANILKEARVAVASIDNELLDREKSILIKNINHSINDSAFYDQHIVEYRDHATLQSLFNEWRQPTSQRDLHKMAVYEDSVMTKLLTPKLQVEEHELLDESAGTSRLLMKVMTQKLNDKYKDVLNEHQRALVKAYAFSVASEDNTTIVSKLVEIKGKLLKKIEERVSSNVDNTFLNDKMKEVKESLINESIEDVDDNTVTRFMLYSKLQNELDTED
jgi:hypothetical protein